MTSQEIIENSISKSLRNKLVFDTKGLPDINYLNVGNELSKNLEPLLKESKLGFIAKQNLNQLLEESKCDIGLSYSLLPIENIGILFEKELKIDVRNILDKYSRDNILLVRWDGIIEKGKLYFLSEEDGITVNIEHLSYTII